MFSLGLGTLKVGLQLEIKDFQSGVAAVRKTLNGLGKSAGLVLMATMLSLGAATAKTIQTFADFEHRIIKAASVSSDGTKALVHFREASLRLSNDVEHSASDMADGLGFLSMAGWNARDSMAALKDMSNLATASGEDFGSVSDYVTNIMSGFRYEVSELGRVSDTLVFGFTSSNTTLASLAKTMEYVGPVASAFNQDITTMVALTGRLGDAGLQGEKAGTALRAMFVRLAKPMKTTREAMKELKVSLADGPQAFHNMIDVIGQLEAAQERLTKTKFNELVARVFGAEALPAVLALLQDGSESLRQFEKDLQNAGGTSEKVAENMRASMSNQLKILSGRVDNAAIRFGQILAPAIMVASNFIKGFTEDVTGNKESFRRLQNMVADGIDTFKAMVPVIGNVIKVAAYVGIVIEKIITGLSHLKNMVKISAQGFAIAWLKLEQLKGDITDEEYARTLRSMKADYDQITGEMIAAEGASEQFMEGALKFIAGIDEAGVVVTKVMGEASTAVRTMEHDQFKALGAAESLKKKMKDFGDSAGDAGKKAKEGILDSVQAMFDLRDTISEVAVEMGQDIKRELDHAFGTQLGNAALIGEAFKRALQGQDVDGLMLTLGKRFGQALASNDFAQLNATMQASMDGKKAEAMQAEAADLTDAVLTGEANRLKNAMAGAFSDVESIFGAASQMVSTMFSGGADGGGGLFQGVLAGLSEAAVNATSPAAAAAAGLKGLAMSLFQTAMETEKGQAMMQAFGDAITDIFGDSFIVDLLSSLEGVHGVFLTVINAFSSLGDMKDMLDFAGRILFNVVRIAALQFLALAEVFLALKLVLVAIPKVIIDAIMAVVDTLNRALSKIPGVGDNAIKADGLRKAQEFFAEQLTKSKDQVVDVAKAMGELATKSYAEAKAESQAAQEAAKAARNMKELNDELKNAPSGFKIARARFGASNGAQTMPGRNVGSEGGGNTINIYGVSDAGSVMDELARRLVVRKGSRYTATFHAQNAFPRLSLVG